MKNTDKAKTIKNATPRTPAYQKWVETCTRMVLGEIPYLRDEWNNRVFPPAPMPRGSMSSGNMRLPMIPKRDEGLRELDRVARECARGQSAGVEIEPDDETISYSEAHEAAEDDDGIVDTLSTLSEKVILGETIAHHERRLTQAINRYWKVFGFWAKRVAPVRSLRHNHQDMVECHIGQVYLHGNGYRAVSKPQIVVRSYDRALPPVINAPKAEAPKVAPMVPEALQRTPVYHPAGNGFKRLSMQAAIASALVENQVRLDKAVVPVKVPQPKVEVILTPAPAPQPVAKEVVINEPVAPKAPSKLLRTTSFNALLAIELGLDSGVTYVPAPATKAEKPAPQQIVAKIEPPKVMAPKPEPEAPIMAIEMRAPNPRPQNAAPRPERPTLKRLPIAVWQEHHRQEEEHRGMILSAG